MAKIMLVANLNCDQILMLNSGIDSGARLIYQDLGRRVGGGAMNTGLGLFWAGHQVEILTQVGSGEMGEWLLNQAQDLGLGIQYIERIKDPALPLQLLIEPNGERTILRPQKSLWRPQLNHDWGQFDLLYVNTDAKDLAPYLEQALQQTLVVAQLPTGEQRRPCHYLIASQDDLTDQARQDCWQYGRAIAGEQLKAFVITQGEQGSTVYTAHKQHHEPAVHSQVVDTTGAGDCYAAGLMHALLNGATSELGLATAAHWAAFAVSAQSSIPPQSLKKYLSAGD